MVSLSSQIKALDEWKSIFSTHSSYLRYKTNKYKQRLFIYILYFNFLWFYFVWVFKRLNDGWKGKRTARKTMLLIVIFLNRNILGLVLSDTENFILWSINVFFHEFYLCLLFFNRRTQIRHYSDLNNFLFIFMSFDPDAILSLSSIHNMTLLGTRWNPPNYYLYKLNWIISGS